MSDSLTSRFQVLLTLALFLPAVVLSLGGDPKQVNENVLSWGGIVAILVVDYVFLELVGAKNLEARLRAVLQALTLINICAFAPLLIIISQSKETLEGFWVVYGFKASLMALAWIPVMITLVLVIQVAFSPNEEI